MASSEEEACSASSLQSSTVENEEAQRDSSIHQLRQELLELKTAVQQLSAKAMPPVDSVDPAHVEPFGHKETQQQRATNMNPSFEGMASVPSSKFPSNFLSSLARKAYIRGDGTPTEAFGTGTINILGRNLSELVPKLFTDCVLAVERDSENFHRRLWRCGEASVQDLSNISSSDATKEELEIIASGKSVWGSDLRKSGWFSGNVLGRRYAREYSSFANKPHAILLADTSPLQSSEFYLDSFGITALFISFS